MGRHLRVGSGVRTTLEEFERAPSFRPDMPLRVLTAERTDGIVPPAFAGYFSADTLAAPRLGAHQRLAQRSVRGSWRIVSGSDHLIASSRPRAVVVEVLAMLEQIR